ncbi:glycosyltransferase [Enterococcus faecium]|uniref:glycosyltransferase n=1 Tax=Enterococcus faecium TaxID=1352 RepID=UPI000F51087A|nr:glycosyltransferase [Enterococcus faecium]MCD5099979.1 glycosyltransferase [Enterococcus faecium]ROZ26560.1 glycosyltransferase [Enterococcus faecium]
MADKKKVLYIVEAMGGGVFTYIVDLANELVNEYDMYIAYAVRKQTPEDYRDYFDKRINLIEVKNFERSINPTKDIRAFFEIKNIAKRIQPDIIHLHSSKAGALGRLAFNGRRLPLFYTPHGYSFLMQNHSALKRMVYKAVETLCAKRNCMTISCSEGEHQETLKLTRNAAYVNNGINIKDLQKLIEKAGPIVDHPFTVFTLGRICYQKNPVLFNKVAAALPEIKFLWIGDGELRDELESPNIEITGWVKREDALRYSLQGDVFILTSLWEGLPISLLESMYMKKLCVVNNVIGNRDVIYNKKNGFVCDSLDDFVKAIREANDHSNYIDNAYCDVLNKYNTAVMAKSYSNIYQAKIGRGGGVQHSVIICCFSFCSCQGEIDSVATPEREVAA